MSLASFAGILILALNPNSPDSTVAHEKSGNWVGAGGTFAHTDDMNRAGLEMTMGFGTSRVQYSVNTPLVLTFVERQDTWRYSFQGPMNGVAWLLTVGIWQIAPAPVAAPMTALLNVWNSHLDVKLNDYIGGSLGLSTEYLFYTTNGAARGIELSPSAGVYFAIPHGPDRWRLVVSAQHSSFIDFHGPDADDGFGFDIRVIFDGPVTED